MEQRKRERGQKTNRETESVKSNRDKPKREKEAKGREAGDIESRARAGERAARERERDWRVSKNVHGGA